MKTSPKISLEWSNKEMLRKETTRVRYFSVALSDHGPFRIPREVLIELQKLGHEAALKVDPKSSSQIDHLSDTIDRTDQMLAQAISNVKLAMISIYIQRHPLQENQEVGYAIVFNHSRNCEEFYAERDCIKFGKVKV